MALEDVAKLHEEIEARAKRSRVFGGKQPPNVRKITKFERALQFSFIKDAKERKRVIDAYQWRQEEISKLEQDWVKETNPKKTKSVSKASLCPK